MLVVSVVMILGQLMSGYQTPIESMPPWLQKLMYLNPQRYIVIVSRNTYLKGADMSDMAMQILPLALHSLTMYVMALLTYKKNKNRIIPHDSYRKPT